MIFHGCRSREGLRPYPKASMHSLVIGMVLQSFLVVVLAERRRSGITKLAIDLERHSYIVACLNQNKLCCINITPPTYIYIYIYIAIFIVKTHEIAMFKKCPTIVYDSMHVHIALATPTRPTFERNFARMYNITMNLLTLYHHLYHTLWCHYNHYSPSLRPLTLFVEAVGASVEAAYF